MVCAVCPVTPVKTSLFFDEESGTFLSRSAGYELKLPDIGFVFPAFNDRCGDVHSALYYAKKETERQDAVAEALFGTQLSMSETTQKNLFAGIVEKALGRDCTFEKVAAASDELELIRQQNQDEPVEIGKEQLRRILKESGAPQEAIERVGEVYDEMVAPNDAMSSDSLAGGTNVVITSPTTHITVKSEAAGLLTTRIIDGQECIVMPVQSDMTYNGIRLLAAAK